MPCCKQCDDVDCPCRVPYLDLTTRTVTIFSNGRIYTWVETKRWVNGEGHTVTEYEVVYLSREEMELLRQSVRNS